LGVSDTVRADSKSADIDQADARVRYCVRYGAASDRAAIDGFLDLLDTSIDLFLDFALGVLNLAPALELLVSSEGTCRLLDPPFCLIAFPGGHLYVPPITNLELNVAPPALLTASATYVEPAAAHQQQHNNHDKHDHQHVGSSLSCI
jgi:hypothetical protein